MSHKETDGAINSNATFMPRGEGKGGTAKGGTLTPKGSHGDGKRRGWGRA